MEQKQTMLQLLDDIVADVSWGRISKEMMDVMKKFPAGHPHAVTPERLARWEAASTHPDENDFKKAEEFFSNLLNK